jgi:uncharacterized protein YndB with AHSA1/START domain
MEPETRRGRIEKKVLIQAAPSVIYHALTDAKDVVQWFCDRATSDARVGGEFRAYWRMGSEGQAQRGRAVFTVLVPDTQVDLHWLDEGTDEIAPVVGHTISYTIRIKRGTAEVTVCDEGPPFADDEIFDLLSEGWISLLRDLKEHCESKQRSSRRHTGPESSPE